jgi:co-chaperonin GroES (HSP10)
MRAFGEYIVVQPQAAKEESEGGIVLPNQQQDPIGTVVSIGHHVDAEDKTDYDRETNDFKTTVTYLKEGDRVIFNGVAASPISVNGVDYVVLNEGDILVVLEDGK